MIVWIDEHLSRRLAPWLRDRFAIDAAHVGELGLSSAPDSVIFHAARDQDVVVLTKDFDFVALLDRLGPPPRLIWLATGNSSTRALKAVLELRFPDILEAFEAGEPMVEINA